MSALDRNYQKLKTLDDFRVIDAPAEVSLSAPNQCPFEPQGSPPELVGEKIEFKWKIESVFNLFLTKSYRPQDPGDLMELLLEQGPGSTRVTCVSASGIQAYRCEYCLEYSHHSQSGACRGCGRNDHWELWSTDKYEVWYSYNL